MSSDFKLDCINIPQELIEILSLIYTRTKKHNPELTKDLFMQRIIEEWLEPYNLNTTNTQYSLSKHNTVLRNNLKNAIKLSGKNQAEISQEVGIDRTYLSRIIKGTYEPSIKLAFLLANSLGYKLSKIEELFYLESLE